MLQTLFGPAFTTLVERVNRKNHVTVTVSSDKYCKSKDILTATVVEVPSREASRESLAEPETKECSPAVCEIDTPTHLISSPYPHLANRLDLRTLSASDRVFAQALSDMQPTRPDYATAPYLQAFNWDTVFARLRELTVESGVRWERRTFYVVIFRSKLRVGADRDHLGELDRMSHEEACASGGLLKYWFGVPDDDRRNLATCLWRAREDAAAGGRGPWHKKARAAAREMYEEIQFLTHTLTIEDGISAWKLEDFADVPCA